MDIGLLIAFINPLIAWGPNGTGDYNTGDLATNYARIEHRGGPALPSLAELEAAVPAFEAAQLEAVREAAETEVKRQAAAVEKTLDDVISGEIRAIMLNTEIVDYVNAGRPANPSVNVYVISAAMATRRDIALRDMLEILFDKWRDLQASIAAISTELDRLIEEIAAAMTEAEIVAIVASANWP